MTIQLKPHQVAARAAILDRLDQGITSQLCAIPTGGGKTILAVSVSLEFQRTLFIAHREELITQTVAAVARVDPDRRVGYVVQGRHEVDAPFVVGMVQTLANRLEQIPPDWFDLLVIDEAHHSSAKTYRTIADHFTPKLRLGLSATPERTDGADLSNLFSELSFELTLAEAIESGYLVKPVARQCLTSCSLSGVKSLGGDLNERDLSVAVDVPERNQFIVAKYQEHAPGRRAIAFSVNIEHARNITAAFNEAGVLAEWVAGDSPDRADKLARFAAGEFQILASCMVLVEGYDCPSVDCVLMCRPTKSRSLYCQQIGRGLRLHPGKSDCIVLDFVDVASRHSLISAWKFFGHTAPPAGEVPLGIADEPKKKEARVAAIDLERQIDLLKPPPVIDEFNYGDRAWHYAPASDKQLLFLQRLGYDTENNDFSKGQACSIIGSQPASWKQLRELADYHYDLSVEWTRAQASRALDESRAVMNLALDKIRSRGFQIEASGDQLKIDPVDQLDLIQRSWIDRNRKPLLSALRSELN